MCSELCVRRSKKLCPQSLAGLRSFAVRFSAAGENCVGETVVPTNGARSGIVRPALQAGDVTAVGASSHTPAGGNEPAKKGDNTASPLPLGSPRDDNAH